MLVGMTRLRTSYVRSRRMWNDLLESRPLEAGADPILVERMPVIKGMALEVTKVYLDLAEASMAPP